MSLIIMEENYGAIDADYSTCHGSYIIKLSWSSYTPQSDLSINGQVISSGEMVCEGTYFLPINTSSHYYVLQKINNTIESLRKIINGNVDFICW